MTAVLARQVFSVSRAADFLEARALVSQTGQPESRFGDVVVKELLDNALDASETAGVQPEITVTIETGGDIQLVTVADNGAGIPPGVVGRILDFATLTSDKALYRSPCRGAQGNALKTIIGIPPRSASPTGHHRGPRCPQRGRCRPRRRRACRSAASRAQRIQSLGASPGTTRGGNASAAAPAVWFTPTR